MYCLLHIVLAANHYARYNCYFEPWLQEKMEIVPATKYQQIQIACDLVQI